MERLKENKTQEKIVKAFKTVILVGMTIPLVLPLATCAKEAVV
jgi:hypothetical protein